MTTRRPIQIAAATMLAAIVVGAVIGVWTIRRVHSVGARVAHATDLKAQLAGLEHHLVDAETGQRGFLLTGVGRTVMDDIRADLDLLTAAAERPRPSA